MASRHGVTYPPGLTCYPSARSVHILARDFPYLLSAALSTAFDTRSLTDFLGYLSSIDRTQPG